MSFEEIRTEEEECVDENYVLNVQNPVQLVSSLAFFLRERNYVCLYDTSILSSPEKYLKKYSISEINNDYLYKWFLFYTGIFRHLSGFDNLIIIPEVIDEISNILNASISAIEKRKSQYKLLSSSEREEFSSVYQQLFKNEVVLKNILEVVSARRNKEKPKSAIFNSILEAVKFLNTHLELKKVSSRVINDTDERIAARAFYEILVNGNNICVYTRDDDIRKLISVTYRLIVYKYLQKNPLKLLLRNLAHLNILVLKYNYEKKVFSRFFESSTLENTDEFKFSRKVTLYTNVNVILQGFEEHLFKIYNAFADNAKLNGVPEEEDESIEDEEIIYTLKNIYEYLCEVESKENIQNYKKKISLYQELSYLTRRLGDVDFADEVMKTTKLQQKKWIESQLSALIEKKSLLESDFSKISSEVHDNVTYDVIKKIQKNAKELEENILKIYFHESCLDNDFYEIKYSKFNNLLSLFQENGFEIGRKKASIPIEKIAEITKYAMSQVIEIIEKYSISHEGRYALLSQKDVLFLLVNK